MVKLAFHKGGKSFYERAIKLWTLGPYSHVEIIIDDVSFSSVPGIGTRYLLSPQMAFGDWDYLDVKMDSLERAHVWNWCMSEMGCGYDWKGIFFAQILGLNRDDPEKWFCSEFCTRALQIGGYYKDLTPDKMSPNSLYRYLKNHVYDAR